MKSLMQLLGRWLLCAVFLVGAVHKVFNWEATTRQMHELGMQMVPLILAAAIVIELLGAFSLFIGSWTRTGALVLLLFLVPTTILFHNFWAVSGEAFQVQLFTFFRNLAIMGGLLYVIAEGPGKLSRDYRRRRVPQEEEEEA